jgi:hypothetical protein
MALNLYTKQEVFPAREFCDEPAAVRIDRTVDVPRMVFGCPPEGEAKPRGMRLHVWTPDKTFEVPGGPWRAGRAYGDFVMLESVDGEPSWLDVRRLRVVEAGDLTLRSGRLATTANDATVDVFLLDGGKGRKLGTVECSDVLRATFDDDDVVTLACGVERTPTAEDKCPSQRRGLTVSHAWAWDLANQAMHESAAPFVGATPEALITADAKMVQGSRACGAASLSAIERK